jgi:hypothetical protein
MSSHANARRLRALLEIQTGIVRRGDGFARPQDSGVYAPVSRSADAAQSAAEGL